jgi:two-component system CheB/CheR fusion protein
MRPFGQAGVRGAVPSNHEGIVGDVANVYRSAMERYGPAGVLVNAENQIVHFSANARDYIHIPGGEPTTDLMALVQEPLRSELPEGLSIAREQSRPWRSAPLSVVSDAGIRRIVIRVEPAGKGRLVLVIFEDQHASNSQVVLPANAVSTIATLEGELSRLQHRLRTALEFRAHGKEAQLSREQVEQATHELHSVLEELSSSKEELQAVNEELIALDEENRRRVQELTQISTDLQHLLASTGVATLFLDRQLRIVRFTPQVAEVFGLRISDLGRPMSDLARLAYYEGFEADARRVLEHEQSIDREVPGPGERWYLSRLLPYRTERGIADGVVLTLIDITERKRAELALREANRQKDEFLAVLAHELRNPLAPISSGIEVLKTAFGDSRTVERIAATMGRQTQQLVRLVDDLLEVSRISGGKLRLRTAVIDLREVIQDALATARPSIEKAGHCLEVRVEEGSLPVQGDSARLTQVLSNLLSNAVRYTPRGGVISVIAGRENDGVEVTVKDNGVGIPHEALAHVFDMFYQGSNARSGFSAGLGIGLTLAKTLVEMHGGTIAARSSGENDGSEFRIRLPLAQAVVVSAEHPAGESAVPLNVDHRILIVDDNVDAAETLSMLMRSLGEREVHTANSGPQALQTAQSLRPDVVLLDLMMPEMDGYEVARRLRSEPWGKDLLLVALSGWGHEEHRRRSREAGFDRHVTKPADLSVLRSMLNERGSERLDGSGPGALTATRKVSHSRT